MKILIADDFCKVFPDGRVIGGTLRPGRRGVALHGGGGEVVSFQIVVVASDSLLSEIRVDAEPLQGPRGASIPADHFESWRVGFVRAPSAGYRQWKPGGWWPDPLFPMQPFRMGRGEIYSVWVNVRIPRDVQGMFRGRVIVRAAGRKEVSVPIRLRAWGFNLPRQHSLVNMFDFAVADKIAGFEKRYGPLAGRGFEPFARFMRYLTDHTVNRLFYNGPLLGSGLLGIEERNGHFKPDLRKAGRVIELFRRLGLGFNAWNVPLWPTADVILDLYPSFERFRSLGDKMHGDLGFNRCLLETSAGLFRHLETKSLADRCFAYIYDEPHTPEHVAHLGMLSRQFKQMCPSARQLAAIAQPARIRQTMDEDLPIDIIVGHLSLYDAAMHARILKSGREYWWYTSNWPTSHVSFWVDEPMVHHRIIYWLTWRYGVHGFAYWNTSVWNMAGYGFDNMDVDRRMEWPYSTWNLSATQFNTNVGNGDGALFYPGPDGPVGSLRFEAIRHGYQDHACLTMLSAGSADRSGLAAKVRNDIGTLKRFTRHPSVLQRLRCEIGKRLEDHNG